MRKSAAVADANATDEQAHAKAASTTIPTARGHSRPQEAVSDPTVRSVKSLKNNEIDRTDRKIKASFYSARAWAITLRMTVGSARSVMRSTVHQAAPGASTAGLPAGAVARATVSSR